VAPVPRQPLQGGLQQVFAIGTATGEHHRGAHQVLPALFD
jgi:hypothetical protein